MQAAAARSAGPQRLRRTDRLNATPHLAAVDDLGLLEALPIAAAIIEREADGGLSDAVAFPLAEGLSWRLGGESGRVRTETDLSAWRTARGAAGRMPPIGFPRDNRFA